MRWEGFLWSARVALILAVIAAVSTILSAQAPQVGVMHLFVPLFPPLGLLIWLESVALGLSKPGTTNRNYRVLMPIAAAATVSLSLSIIILTIGSVGGA